MKKGKSILRLSTDTPSNRRVLKWLAARLTAGNRRRAQPGRELREELGIEAQRWFEVGMVYPLTSMIHAPATLFIATGLSFFESEPGAAESIRMVRVKLSEAVRMVMESEIKHAHSCVLILKASHFLNEKNEERSR